MEYVLRHKNNNVYLKRFGDIKLNHYVFNIKDATKFDRRNANSMLKKFKHPENWELKVVVGSDKRKKEKTMIILIG